MPRPGLKLTGITDKIGAMPRSVLCAWLALTAMLGQAQDSGAPRYSASGSLLLPADYREWIFLSCGLGMTYGPIAAHDMTPRFDNVFVSRPAYAVFLKTGTWPDKTMFVLEVRAAEAKGSINQGGHYQGAVVGIESEVKEAGRWTFYGFDRGSRKVSRSHVPKAAMPAMRGTERWITPSSSSILPFFRWRWREGR